MIAHPTNIAILDDDLSIRKALGRLLKATGMLVQTYATGDELLESLALKCPDCLILDLQMPKMSGLDVLKHLGQGHIRIPTIVITAHDEPGSRSACLNAGATAYLCKPLDADDLIQTIGTVCEPPLRETPLREASPPLN